MLNFPNEVLLRIFSFVRDDETFNNILPVSPLFHVLGNDELTRNQYWERAEDVQPRFDHWTTNPRRHRVQELNFELSNDLIEQNNIFSSLSIFPNLTSLTIRNGTVSAHMSHIYTALTSLQNLRRLRLEQCKFLPITRAVPPTITALFTVKHLILHNIHFLIDFDFNSPIDAQLAKPVECPLPLTLLGGLEELSISSDDSGTRAMGQATLLIPHTPRLIRLSVTGPFSTKEEDEHEEVHPPIQLPLLTGFRGPYRVALSLIRSAVNMEDVTVTDELTSEQALAVLAGLHPHAVRSIELKLTRWADDVLYEIAHRFASCKRIKIVYCYGGPTQEFLFVLGVHHLSRMPALDTLLIHARPEDAMDREPRYSELFRAFFAAHAKWVADGVAGKRITQPFPTNEVTKELLAVWRRYVPLLKLIKFGKCRWTRESRGGAWKVEAIDADGNAL
ncbi:hypothetical protein B0H12DRAFT_1240776 [Mycena haematopus]|nr:hypothetical protein B0H12DRAFT_1240776 [Mycena haematopus]